MTIGQWLKKSTQALLQTSIPTARLDAEVLLADELQKDRSWLNAHPEYELTEVAIKKLAAQIELRSKHEPLAYIRGKQEFYGREFIVSPDTLTPRPETETMIDLLLETMSSKQLKVERRLQIVDVGTGSGCIIITAALELAYQSTINYQLSFTGLDVSEEALKIAQKNAQNLHVAIDFQKYDLTKAPLPLHPTHYTLITANLPYVPDDFHINLAASHEPQFAIYGGVDGLDYYRSLFSKLADDPNCIVFTESLPPQHEKLATIAQGHGFKCTNKQDFIQEFQRK
jgi:release factor glutamine methyltransferase